MDLLFIRQMKESGYNIFNDPEIDMNLLYDKEREKLFKEKEDKVEKVKKKGPRQILNPDLATLEFKVDLGDQKFDAHEFRERLEQGIRNLNLSPEIIEKMKR